MRRRPVLALARFELGYQLRSPVFWAAAAMLFLLVFAATASPTLRLGAPASVHVNAPRAIAQVHLVLSLLHMFVALAMVSSAAVRDDESGFAPILFSTPIGKSDYLLGRLAGGLAASSLAFLAVPLAMVAATSLASLDPETLGPTRLADYVHAYLLLALPTLVAISAILFALAALARSILAASLGAVGLLILHFGAGTVSAATPDLRWLLVVLDPFGLAALADMVRYWPVEQSNSTRPALEGALLWGRLLWLGVAAAATALALARYSFAENQRSTREAESRLPRELRPAAQPLVHLREASHGPRMLLAQLSARTRLEVRLVLASPAFLALLALGLAHATASLAFGGDLVGVPTLPVTREVIPILITSFSIVPTVAAVIYAGEAVWRERDWRLAEIVDAAPLPGWVNIAPKIIAVSLVLLAMLALGAIAAIATQLADGFTFVEPGKYLLWYLLPIGFDAVIIAALAVFVQAIAAHKYLGWAMMALYVLLRLSAGSVGLDHSLLLYGEVPQFAYSDMSGAGGFWVGAWWFRAHWAAWAAMLLLLAHLFWRRGTETRLRPRIAGALRQLTGGTGGAAAATLLAICATGSWIFYNTDILNERRGRDENERRAAEYERRYARFLSGPHPTLTSVTLNVELLPAGRRAEIRGRYRLTNLSDRIVQDVHVRFPDREIEVLRLDFPGARLEREDAELGYRVYRLERAMAPGEIRQLSFQTRRWPRGFRDRGEDTNLVENGTFLTNLQLAPVIGMDRTGFLQESSVRRNHGLAPASRPATLEDPSGGQQPLFGGGWTSLDITVSTAADQIPIAPGEKVWERVHGSRRTARYVSRRPMLGFYAVQSAQYAQQHRVRRGVDLTVFHHRAHGWNVDTMLDALEAGLEHYERNFGPYPMRQLRLAEFPAYAGFSQAFPGTIAVSEMIAFVADARDPRGSDYLTFVAAHELAHQWWVHQLIPADVQGATMLAETLAQYSALAVIRRLRGDAAVRRFLRRELDEYLRSRGHEGEEELPLARVENQQYIHYNKGSLVMSLLARRLGEEAVRRAMVRLLERFRFRGPPYPRSTDFIALLRQEARGPAQQALITDLLERITLYDFKVEAPTATRRADGRWDVVVPVHALKVHADGRGKETEAFLDEPLEIGLFSVDPGSAAFEPSDVLMLKLLPVRSGRQFLRFVTRRRPTHAGVDPYNFYIDRNAADNVAAVQ